MTDEVAPDDLPTLCAIGVLALLAALLSHELVGHGAACLAAGGEVRLVSTIYFRCEGGDALTDIGGPLGNLVLGLIALVAIASRRVVLEEGRLFALIAGGVSLFWFCAQVGVAALLDQDDWSYAAGQAGWSPMWRIGAVVLAIAGYDLTRRAMTRSMRTLSTGQGAAADRRRFLAPWGAGVVAAVVSAAFFGGARLGGMGETLLTVGAAPVGLGLAVFLASRLGATGPGPAGRIPRRPALIAIAAVAFVLYCATVGLGLGGGDLT